MARTQRGTRDGTGPFEGSYRSRTEGRRVGRRRASDPTRCPYLSGNPDDMQSMFAGLNKTIVGGLVIGGILLYLMRKK